MYLRKKENEEGRGRRRAPCVNMYMPHTEHSTPQPATRNPHPTHHTAHTACSTKYTPHTACSSKYTTHTACSTKYTTHTACSTKYTTHTACSTKYTTHSTQRRAQHSTPHAAHKTQYTG
jgi:hypothetical protein